MKLSQQTPLSTLISSSRVLTLLLLALLCTGCGNVSISRSPSPLPATTSAAHAPDLYDLTAQGLYALDSRTGAQIWHNSSVVAGHLPIVNGKIVYIDNGSNLYAFDAQHGTLRWQFAYGGHPEDSNNTNSKLLVGQSGIYLVEGTDVFASTGPQYGMGGTQAPPLTPTPSSLFAFDPATGKLRWYHTLSYRLNDPVIKGDVIYGVGSTTRHGLLYALKGSDGSVLWQRPLAQTSKLYYGFIADSGTLYCASTSNTAHSQIFLYAYSLSDGGQRWQSQPMDSNATNNITFSGDALYYPAGEHDLYAFSTRNGKLLWRHTIPTLISNYLLPVANGQIYSVTQQSLNNPPYYLQAFKASSSQQVWSRQLALSGSAVTWLMVDHDHLYVYSNDASRVPDKMTVFNPATGTFITSYPLPTDSGISKLAIAA